jgi:membrane protease YdiL (CAAX protease family)
MKFKASFTTPLFALGIYGLFLVSRLTKSKLVTAGGNGYLSVIILQLLLFILPAIVFCRLKGVGYAAKLNLRLFSPTRIGAVISSSLAMIFGSILIRLAQIYLFGMTSFSYSPFESYLGSGTEYEFLFAATAFAVMPALSDELVFRTVMLTEYNEGGYGGINATLITALLSSFLFFTPESFPIRFLCGILLGMVTYATGSSLAALFSHLIFNIYAVFGEKYILRAMSDPSNKIIGIFTFTVLFLVILFICFGELEHSLRRMGQAGVPSPSYLLKKTDDGETPDVAATEKEEEGGNAKALSERSRMTIEAMFSPTLLICIILYLVTIFGFI